jgi:diguanylate cyclase (GGDEF)-like protein/PAS domain S-box-containing protein
MSTFKEEHKVISITAIAVIFIWTADTAYDSFISHEGSFFQLLVNVTEREPFLRMFMTLSFLVFGIVLAGMLSKRDRAEDLLKRHSAAIEASMDGIALYNRNGAYIYANQAYASINGYSNPDELMSKTVENAYDEKELERMKRDCFPALQKNGRWRGELVARRKNGSTYFQEASVTLLEDGGRVCIIRDITWRKRSEERLQRSERFLNTIFDSIRDPFCILDDEFYIIRVNKAYALLKNRRVDELIGQKCHKIFENRDTVCESCVVQKSFYSQDPCAKEKHITVREGTSIWVEIYTYPILDENGNVSHVIEYTRDITERKRAEDEKRRLIERLEHLSKTDSLTGLTNRRALTESLTYEMDRAKRYGSDLSLILCDIDSFKAINDTFGHDSGDRALQAISETLRTVLRKADIAGRYGGDEFMVILPETSIEGAESLADKLLTVVRVIRLQFAAGQTVQLSMSIGVAGLKMSDNNIDSLIKRADDAMYASKQRGRNCVSTISR